MATTTVTASFAVLDMEIGYWARAQYTVTFSRGGAVTTTAFVKSLPIDAYQSVPALLLLDVFVLLYALVHWTMLGRNVVHRVRRVRVLCARATAVEAFWHAVEIWFLIDLATGASACGAARGGVGATAAGALALPRPDTVCVHVSSSVPGAFARGFSIRSLLAHPASTRAPFSHRATPQPRRCSRRSRCGCFRTQKRATCAPAPRPRRGSPGRPSCTRR